MCNKSQKWRSVTNQQAIRKTVGHRRTAAAGTQTGGGGIYLLTFAESCTWLLIEMANRNGRGPM